MGHPRLDIRVSNNLDLYFPISSVGGAVDLHSEIKKEKYLTICDFLVINNKSVIDRRGQLLGLQPETNLSSLKDLIRQFSLQRDH